MLAPALRVILETIHSAQGLEFPHVVLCGIWREGEDLEVNRKLVSVGMVRATDYLAVVTREGQPLVARPPDGDCLTSLPTAIPDRDRSVTNRGDDARSSPAALTLAVGPSVCIAA